MTTPEALGAATDRDATSPRSGQPGRSRPLELLSDYAIVVCVVLLTVVLAVTSDVFLTSENLLNVLEQVAPVGIIACALTFVLVVGEFDLAAGAVYVITGVIAAKLTADLGAWPAIGIGVVAALALGIVNGALVAYARVDSFVCTLATGLMIAGLSLVVTEGFLLTVTDPAFSDLGIRELAGIKYSIIIFAAVAVFCGFVLSRTKLGRWMFATGGNREAARLSGINTQRVVVLAFACSGLAAGIAGAIVASRTGQGQAGDGIGVVLFAFAAVVVGGTSVAGGRGAIWRTVLGVLFLGLISNGFNLLEVEPIYQQIVQGAIILVAVAADAISRRRLV